MREPYCGKLLEGLGQALAGPRASVERSTPGLWLDRVLLAVADMHLWLEIPHPGGPYDPASASLPGILALAGLLGDEHISWLKLPDPGVIDSFGIFAFRAIPPSVTVFELLYGIEGRAEVVPFFQMGEELARFHRSAADGPIAEVIPRGRPRVRLIPHLFTETLRNDGLQILANSLRASERLLEMAIEADREIEARPDALLHGRWSTGALLCPADAAARWLALGGLDCWIGPGEYDLGYLLGELLEFAVQGMLAGREAAIRESLDMARAFISGYGRTCAIHTARTIRFVAHRILSHHVANHRWRHEQGIPRASLRETVSFLSLSELLLPELEQCMST